MSQRIARHKVMRIGGWEYTVVDGVEAVEVISNIKHL